MQQTLRTMPGDTKVVEIETKFVSITIEQTGDGAPKASRLIWHDPPREDMDPAALRPERSTFEPRKNAEHGKDQGWGDLSIKTKILSFAECVRSGLAPRGVYRYRAATCTGQTLDGIVVADPCPMMTQDEEGRAYCGACGCGKWRLSRLLGRLGKLRWKAWACPIGRYKGVT